MNTQNSFRATRHAPTAQHYVRLNTHHTRRWVLRSWGKGTAERADSSFRTQTVPMNTRPIKASRRVRTTLYRTWYAWNEGGSSGFIASRRWNPLHGMLTMSRSRWRRKPCRHVPMPLSHRSTSPTLNTFTPCTLGRLNAGSSCVGGVPRPHGCETSIPQPLKYILFSFVLFLALFGGVFYASY